MGVVVEDGLLYIAGGMPHHFLSKPYKPPRRDFVGYPSLSPYELVVSDDDNYDDDDNDFAPAEELTKVYRYDPRIQQWLELKEMKSLRACFVLAALDDHLLAIGGKPNIFASNKSVEKYNIEKNEWSLVCDLPTVLFSHAGCTLNGEVYVSGGHDQRGFETTSDELLCYNPNSNQWSLRSPMVFGRACHSMVSHKNSLFVCAGYSGSYYAFSEEPDYYPHDVEHYDITSDQWTSIKSLSPSLTYTYVESPYVNSGTCFCNTVGLSVSEMMTPNIISMK